ncbi:LRR domain containing protein [Trema orientale]|uniref:LRR domain containing protein n=1 Tax=Trema orientale TaxID=63057 RepID=A0A2P5E6W2_TREOI|nr:LRR domain containing protein [Trema orientale]
MSRLATCNWGHSWFIVKKKQALCNIWIAESFVKARENKTLEEEARGYLNELIERNLVSLEIGYGLSEYCKVHDLMHEFILSKANELCFCQVLDKKKSEFGGTLVSMLPKTIGKLHSLRTLNLVSTLVRELPVEINKLRSLQHIYASCDHEKTLPSDQRWSIGVKIQEGFGYLENLETLENVEVHLGFMKDLTNLSKLKALGVRLLTTETSRAICVTTENSRP